MLKNVRNGFRASATLRDVNHHRNLFVTEVATSLAICTRWNGGPEGGITGTGQSFLSANVSFIH